MFRTPFTTFKLLRNPDNLHGVVGWALDSLCLGPRAHRGFCPPTVAALTPPALCVAQNGYFDNPFTAQRFYSRFPNEPVLQGLPDCRFFAMC